MADMRHVEYMSMRSNGGGRDLSIIFETHAPT